MKHQSVDILIVGGGLIGAALTIALHRQGYQTLMLETKDLTANDPEHFDARTLALSPASVAILEMLGVWAMLSVHATPIYKIHVSEQQRFGCARLHSGAGQPLGYVLDIDRMNKILNDALPRQAVLAPASLESYDKELGIAHISCGDEKRSIQTQLLVAADGAQSLVRRLLKIKAHTKDYQQHAIVANIALARSHDYCAYERFTPDGPLALLPISQQRSALIWAMPPMEAKRLAAVSDEAFLQALQAAFGYRLGRFIKTGTRHIFPLKQVILKQTDHWPVVFIGNAAHALHPVAGQGFNLGLRDVAMLAQCIAALGLNKKMLASYQEQRQSDQRSIRQFTDGLVQLFGQQLPGLGLARSAGMLILDNSRFLKELLGRHARGYGGIIPDLVCKIPLATEAEC